jgi:hypothetical protein
VFEVTAESLSEIPVPGGEVLKYGLQQVLDVILGERRDPVD